jgi:hypothetical protein
MWYSCQKMRVITSSEKTVVKADVFGRYYTGLYPAQNYETIISACRSSGRKDLEMAGLVLRCL